MVPKPPICRYLRLSSLPQSSRLESGMYKPSTHGQLPTPDTLRHAVMRKTVLQCVNVACLFIQTVIFHKYVLTLFIYNRTFLNQKSIYISKLSLASLNFWLDAFYWYTLKTVLNALLLVIIETLHDKLSALKGSDFPIMITLI